MRIVASAGRDRSITRMRPGILPKPLSGSTSLMYNRRPAASTTTGRVDDDVVRQGKRELFKE